jgi:transposase-like protein
MTKLNRAPVGRPTKFTPETRARLVQLIARGLPFVHACHAVGIATQSFITYRNNHEDFREEIEQAVAAAIERRLKIIEDAADKGDVNSAKWLLEHLHPAHFARNRIEVTGADGAPLTGAIALYLPQKDGNGGAHVVTVDAMKEVENGNGE